MAATRYDIRLRRRQNDIHSLDLFTRTIDFDDDAQVSTVDGLLLQLLIGAVKRSGGDVRDLDEYDLQLYRHGRGGVEMTFAASASEVPEDLR